VDPVGTPVHTQPTDPLTEMISASIRLFQYDRGAAVGITTGKRVVSNAGAVLFVAADGKIGLDRALSAALTPWRKQQAVLDPGTILLVLAISFTMAGNCPSRRLGGTRGPGIVEAGRIRPDGVPVDRGVGGDPAGIVGGDQSGEKCCSRTGVAICC